VTGRTHPRFWKHFSALPFAVQKLAREKYTRNVEPRRELAIALARVLP
jgi:hypothetical protein